MVDWVIVGGGVLALSFFIILGAGLFFAGRTLKRFIDNILFFKKLSEDHKELINTFIEGTATNFKKEILLMNIFTEAEIRKLVYAFIQIKSKQLKGGVKKLSLWNKIMKK